MSQEQTIKIYKEIPSCVIEDKSTLVDGSASFTEYEVVTDNNNASEGYLDLATKRTGNNFPVSDSFAVEVFVSSSQSDHKVIGGFGSSSWNAADKLASGNKSFKCYRNAPEFYLKGLSASEIPNIGNIEDSKNSEGTAQQYLLGKVEPLVWDYFPTDYNIQTTGNNDSCIVGTNNSLLRISFSQSRIHCEKFYFQSNEWEFLSNIGDKGLMISKKISMTVDTLEHSEELNYSISPTATYDKNLNRVYLAFNEYDEILGDLVISIYKSDDEGNNWTKISSIKSGFDFYPDKSIIREIVTPYVQINSILFRLKDTSIVTDKTVYFTDTVSYGSEAANIVGSALVIEIESGVSTVREVLNALDSNVSIRDVYDYRLIGYSTSKVYATEDTPFNNNTNVLANGDNKYENDYIKQINIIGYSGMSNRLRICFGGDRLLIVSALAYKYTIKMYIEGPTDPEEDIEHEYHSMIWNCSLDEGLTWNGLYTPPNSAPASPLMTTIQNALRVDLGVSGVHRANLFDYFSPGSSAVSYYESVSQAVTGRLTNLNYSTLFGLYFDEIMQQFVVVKRADGLSNNDSFICFIRTDSHNCSIWSPLLIIEAANEMIDSSFVGTNESNYEKYIVDDCHVVAFEDDYNYMILEVTNNNNQNNSQQDIICIPFKFLSKMSNSLDPNIDIFSGGYSKRNISRASKYYFMTRKMQSPESRIQPHYCLSVDYGDSVENVYNMFRASVCKFRDSLFIESRSAQDPDSIGLAVTNYWANWNEKIPYEISEIPWMQNSSGVNGLNDTWNTNVGSTIGCDSDVSKLRYAFTVVSGGANSYSYSINSGLFDIGKSFKCKTRVNFVNSEDPVNFSADIIYFSLNTNMSDSVNIVVTASQIILTNKYKFTFKDALNGNTTLFEFDQSYGTIENGFVDINFFVRYNTASQLLECNFYSKMYHDIESNEASFGEDWNCQYSFAELGETVASSSTMNIKFGLFNDTGNISFTGGGTLTANYKFFSASSYNTLETENSNDEDEGKSSTQFVSERRQYSYGRKASRSLVKCPYDLSIGLEGIARRNTVFYVGFVPSNQSIAKLLNSYSKDSMKLPMKLSSSQYSSNIRISSVDNQVYDRIYFTNTILQEFTVNLYSSRSDNTVDTSFTSGDLEYCNHVVGIYSFSVIGYNLIEITALYNITTETESSLGDDLISEILDPENMFGITMVNGTPYYVTFNYVEANIISVNAYSFDSAGNRSEVAITEIHNVIKIYRKNFHIECPKNSETAETGVYYSVGFLSNDSKSVTTEFFPNQIGCIAMTKLSELPQPDGETFSIEEGSPQVALGSSGAALSNLNENKQTSINVSYSANVFDFDSYRTISNFVSSATGGDSRLFLSINDDSQYLQRDMMFGLESVSVEERTTSEDGKVISFAMNLKEA